MVEWARACGYEPAPHHQFIIKYLERIASGDLTRLLIAAPPGSAKSTYASVLFPCWYLSKHPTHHVICVSNVVELAEKHARRARNLIKEHSAALGISIDENTSAAGRWSLTAGGSTLAIGQGGAILGARADILILDDLIKSREEAMSESARERLHEYFISDLLSRLRPGGKVCLISTRFSEDDLWGRLAQTSRYEIVSLPAQAETADDPLQRAPGEYLWDSDPEYPYGGFLRMQKENQLPSNWSALFQQRPAPEEGAFFLTSYFRQLSVMPARDDLHIYGSSDYAVSEGRGDWTVHLVVGLDKDGQLYLLDLWRAQADTATSIDAFLDLVKQWRPIG
jgi:hypothetical protein